MDPPETARTPQKQRGPPRNSMEPPETAWDPRKQHGPPRNQMYTVGMERLGMYCGRGSAQVSCNTEQL